MKAAIIYIFQNKRYRKIQEAYFKATTNFKMALDVWAEYESLTISEEFEFKTLVADNILYLQSIQTWIHTYNIIKEQCSAGLIYFYSERGSKTVPNPKLDDYRIVSENHTTIETYQRYSDTHRRLMTSCREAMERFRAGAFNNFKLDVVKEIALGERRILAIADVLIKAHTCEMTYKRAWKIFANGRSFDNIPLQELENINEDSFATKNEFLYYYDKTPKLISLILGKAMLPIDSFSEEAITQEQDTYLILCSKDDEPKIESEPFHADIHLEPGKELKRAILDSISYGEKCNFVDTYSISQFYTLRRDFDAIVNYFDDAVSKVQNNISAVKAYNKERGNEAVVFIEDYLRASTEGEALYNFIETYKQEKDKRDNAKRIKRSYPKGFLAIFGELDIDTCSLSYVINVIEAESRVRIKHNEIEAAEQKHIEAEKKRQEEERKKSEIRDLKACVSSWPQPTNSNVNCFSFYYYYPINCYFDASSDEWDVRNLIWDFKAKPHHYQPESEIMQRHNSSVDKVLPLLRKTLHHFFGSKVRKLTIVPIPASTKVVCDRRYKDIMERICSDMDMYNGYSHMKITRDGISKNDPSNMTDHSIPPAVEYDNSFFKDKYVILFDDVITSGNSMERFKRLLESAGAIVIGGLSIGKTKHERQRTNPIDQI